MSAKTVVITGASDGIGTAAARALHADGHEVVIVGRSPEKTRAVAGELGVASFTADFARLDDVRTLADALVAAYPRIDVLANNAGGIFGDRTPTVDGFERTLQVNHLAPFLLTHLLLDPLLAAGASVINTSSVAAARFGRIDLDDLGNEHRYSAEKAYGDAKLANVLFTRGLQAHYGDRGLFAAAFHPGVVATSFASDTTSLMRWIYQTPLSRVFGLIGPEKGADTLVWLAEGQGGRDWPSGEYFARRRVARTNPQAADDDLVERFWQRSAELVGITTGV